MDIPVYLGRGRTLESRRYGEKTHRFFTLKTDEANHMLFLGGSGYGKTTVLRAIAEAIWLSCNFRGVKPLIIIFERKFDVSKAEKIRQIYYYESQKYSEKKLYKKYGEETWKYVEKYVKLMEKDPLTYGCPGDFAMGMPNVLGKYTKFNGENSILGYFGLEPRAFPVNRFVFRPTRSLESIQIDNGWMTNVIDAKIKYDLIDYSFIKHISHLGDSTLYGERIRNLWDVEMIRDPDKVLERARELEVSDPPSRTYLRIEEAMMRLKKDPLFTKEGSFFRHITNKRINVIDFSLNSNLKAEEENLIFKLIVNFGIMIAYKYKIPVFFFVDEIQHFARSPIGLSAIDRIYREGRSMGIGLIGATQYLAGIRRTILDGCTHLGIVGKIGSPEDLAKLKRIIPGIDEFEIGIADAYTLEEYLKMKKRNKFRGYFAYDKELVERIIYRHPQSL